MDSDTAAPAISPADRDMMVRTIIGEADNQPDIGKVAVAHTILNRLAAGGYGNTATDVVTAPKQFEPWQSKAGQLMAYSPDDPSYQNAARAVEMAVSGQASDPTGGAVNFYSPSSQAALGRQAPSWAKGPSVQIGAHLFYGGKGGAAQSASGGTTMAQADPNEISDADIEKLIRGQGAPSTARQTPASASASTASQPGEMSDDDIGALLTGKSPATAPSSQPARPANDTADAHPLTIRPAGPGVGETPFGAIDPNATPQPDAYSQGGGTAAAVGRGIVNGVPVVGPYLTAGLDRGMAAARALTKDEPYSQALQEVQNFGQQTAANNPGATTAGALLGNVAAFGGLGATQVGATALGMGEGNLLLRAATGGTTNAAIGGTDNYIRSGGDDDATRTGAALGLTFGALGPAAGALAGVAGDAVGNAVNSFRPATAADNALAASMRGTGADVNALQQRLADNPRLSLMDVNPGARTLAQGLAAQPGAARDTLVQTLANRTAGARGAVTGAYDAAMGPTPDVLATLTGIQQTAANNARQGFGQALANAKPVDLTAAIQGLDNQIRPGIGQVVSPGSDIPLSPIQQRLQQIRNQIVTPDGSEMLTDATRLHQMQSDLRNEGETLLSSSSGSDRLMGRAVMNARGSIVDAIDNATGGRFKPAQQQYASDQAVGDAFNKGLSIFQNRAGVNGLEDRPEYWRNVVANATPAEQQALTLGVRTAADQAMSSVRNPALKGETITQTPANLAKLRAILGDQEANRLAQRMTDEQDMAATNHALFEGTQTQPRQAAQLATAVRAIGPLTADVGLPSLAYVNGSPLTAAGLGTLAVGRRVLEYAGQRADLARNALQANALSATGPEAQATLNRLMSATTPNPGAQQPVNALAHLLATSAPTDYARYQGRPTRAADVTNRLLRSGSALKLAVGR